MSTRTYVVDTSVILSDPASLQRFAEHEVVLPVVVVTELEAKRHHGELGAFARAALRMLDALREEHGRLDLPVPIGEEGGTLHVELNHADDSVLPRGLRLGDNDTRIQSVAAHLAGQGKDVTVVSKDTPMRIKAAAVGLTAEDYRSRYATDPGWSGVVGADLAEDEMTRLWDEGSVPVADLDAAAPGGPLRDQPVRTGVVLHSPRGAALGRLGPGGTLQLVKGEKEVFGLRGRSAEQRIAIDHLTDPGVGIVSLGGRAGTGKSALALCAGLEAVLERQEHRRVLVFRPLYAVGGQELGYLPGTEADKMNPWAQAVFDTFSSVVPPEVIEEVMARDLLEVQPLTHIRGRSLHDAFVIVDEAQSLERGVLLTVLSRIGQNSKVVLTHDVAQRDNLRVGRHDGIAAVIDALRGHDLFAHVTLTRPERSAIAALVTDLLERDQTR